MATCTRCNGTGITPCNECYGSGKRFDKKPCNYCKGTKEGKCIACYGTGRK